MTSEDRFRAYMQAFNAGDWDRLRDYYAPDVRLVIGNGTELNGRDARSEERRVGKECRSRWSPYH